MTHRFTIVARDYDLSSTLTSGQAFRWRRVGAGWESVVGGRWVRLVQTGDRIRAEASGKPGPPAWLVHYLQSDVRLSDILGTFPADAPLQLSIAACRGLRLLRQDPWECLASFILSSTKQIVQIQQICSLLCERYGDPTEVLPLHPWARTFPRPEVLSRLTEGDLRACKMGFRAPHLLGAAKAVAEGRLRLEVIQHLDLEEARRTLCSLRGVGPKIADCVLLFAYPFPRAFPVDVWVEKAIRALYFPRSRVTPRRIREFVDGHFGPHAGYAQQYLFHYMRTRPGGSAQAPSRNNPASTCVST